MTYVENPAPRAYRVAISADLRSPSDAELTQVLDRFVPAHSQFGELTYTRALRESLEQRRPGARPIPRGKPRSTRGSVCDRCRGRSTYHSQNFFAGVWKRSIPDARPAPANRARSPSAFRRWRHAQVQAPAAAGHGSIVSWSCRAALETQARLDGDYAKADAPKSGSGRWIQVGMRGGICSCGRRFNRGGQSPWSPVIRRQTSITRKIMPVMSEHHGSAAVMRSSTATMYTEASTTCCGMRTWEKSFPVSGACRPGTSRTRSCSATGRRFRGHRASG